MALREPMLDDSLLVNNLGHEQTKGAEWLQKEATNIFTKQFVENNNNLLDKPATWMT